MEITAGAVNDDEQNTKKVDVTKRCDRLSELPEEILSLVLSFLTMRDAVKTRVLSRKWRYLFASTSKLWFDPFTMFGINYDPKYLFNHPDMLWPFWEGIEFACHIDRWISFALRMQTEEIHLNFSTVPQGCERYYFPCHLLPQASCKKSSLIMCCTYTTRFDSKSKYTLLETILAVGRLMNMCVAFEASGVKSTLPES